VVFRVDIKFLGVDQIFRRNSNVWCDKQIFWCAVKFIEIKISLAKEIICEFPHPLCQKFKTLTRIPPLHRPFSSHFRVFGNNVLELMDFICTQLSSQRNLGVKHKFGRQSLNSTRLLRWPQFEMFQVSLTTRSQGQNHNSLLQTQVQSSRGDDRTTGFTKRVKTSMW
jgi:hypothetical protein